MMIFNLYTAPNSNIISITNDSITSFKEVNSTSYITNNDDNNGNDNDDNKDDDDDDDLLMKHQHPDNHWN